MLILESLCPKKRKLLERTRNHIADVKADLNVIRVLPKELGDEITAEKILEIIEHLCPEKSNLSDGYLSRLSGFDVVELRKGNIRFIQV